MSVYIGVNNIAKKVSSLYIGVNNKARKVKSGYIGVNNKAHSFLSSGPDVTKTEYTEAEINELAAYGDFIESIVADTANCELTFTYYVDAHLKATSAGTARDDDNNILYKWKDFEVDKTSQFKNFGVKYVRTQ